VNILSEAKDLSSSQGSKSSRLRRHTYRASSPDCYNAGSLPDDSREHPFRQDYPGIAAQDFGQTAASGEPDGSRGHTSTGAHRPSGICPSRNGGTIASNNSDRPIIPMCVVAGSTASSPATPPPSSRNSASAEEDTRHQTRRGRPPLPALLHDRTPPCGTGQAAVPAPTNNDRKRLKHSARDRRESLGVPHRPAL
jgi:hypothetical protein